MNEYTPLYIASAKGHLEIVKYLVEKGANLNGIDGYCYSINNEYIPLHVATSNGYFEIVKYLIEKGANMNATNYIR